MTEPIFLDPIFKERIWGGGNLRDIYNYNIPSDYTGECWGISAHENGQTVVRSGKYIGKTLGEIWEKESHLFGDFKSDCFPLLVKILDANADLSIQVHPSDEYAEKFEYGELGKTECWYILDCKQDATIILGHSAQTKEDFIKMINEDRWAGLLKTIKIKPGDFFYVPSGTIHALCKGTLVLETQQSSDTTYRVYDYNRIGIDGKLRDLHLNKAIDVITIPHEEVPLVSSVIQQKGGTITTFVENNYFSVYKWDINSYLEIDHKACFTLCSVVKGKGEIHIGKEVFSFQKGDHFILPNSVGEIGIRGESEIITSKPNTK